LLRLLIVQIPLDDSALTHEVVVAVAAVMNGQRLAR
jgi:hypothetical protein